MELSQQEHWSGLLCPPPGDLPDPGIEPRAPTLQAGSLPAKPLRKPLMSHRHFKFNMVKIGLLISIYLPPQIAPMHVFAISINSRIIYPYAQEKDLRVILNFVSHIHHIQSISRGATSKIHPESYHLHCYNSMPKHKHSSSKLSQSLKWLLQFILHTAAKVILEDHVSPF